MGYYEDKMREKFENSNFYAENIECVSYDQKILDVIYEAWKAGYEEGAEDGESDAWSEAYETGYKRPREG